MSDKKAPKFTEQDLIEAEAGHYYIQIGDDIFITEDGMMAFNKKRAEHFFDVARAGLEDMKQNGNEQLRTDAVSCLMFLRIHPLRIH